MNLNASPRKYVLKSALCALWVFSLFVAVKSESRNYANAAIGVAMYEADMGRYPRKRSVYNTTGGTLARYPGTSIEMISMSLTGSASPGPG